MPLWVKNSRSQEKAEEGKTVTIWKDKQSGEFKACIKK